MCWAILGRMRLCGRRSNASNRDDVSSFVWVALIKHTVPSNTEYKQSANVVVACGPLNACLCVVCGFSVSMSCLALVCATCVSSNSKDRGHLGGKVHTLNAEWSKPRSEDWLQCIFIVVCECSFASPTIPRWLEYTGMKSRRLVYI